MNEHNNLDLLSILVSMGEIGESSAHAVRKFMEKWSMSAFDAVMECQVISEQKVADIFAKRLKLPRITELNPKDVDENVFCIIPFRYAVALVAMPVGFGNADDELRVMVADPMNKEVLTKLTNLTKKRIQLLIGERGYVRQSIEDLYPLHLQIDV